MNIEFIDPVVPTRRAWLCVLGLGALAAVLFAAGRVMEARAVAIQSEARAQLAASALVQATPRAEPLLYAEDLKRAFDRAALPEAVVLKELETVSVLGIQLTSIDIDMSDHVATVELQAGGDEALGDYLDQLNAGLPAPVWHIERLAAGQSVSAPLPGGGAVSRSSVQNVTLERHF